MSTKQDVKVKILVMDRHFLYLPLYVAQFDHPASRKLPYFGKVDAKYSIEVIPMPPHKERSDAAVFDALMSARLGSSDIMFAACDPTVLIARPEKNALMAASLISSSAFWAVNHDVSNVRLFSDLSSFNPIICYGERTTSNLIARRIVKRDTGKLMIVPSTDEIRALAHHGAGALAISPEILKIANLLYEPLRAGEKRHEIVLDLSTTKEFSNVLTTALFTRAEVVEQHPDLVSGILTAIQSALVAIHAGHKMVIECAKSNFEDAFHVEQALAIAQNSNVFPETIQVRRDRWQRACEFYYSSHAAATGKEKNSLTKEQQLNAEQLYTQSVLDRGLRILVIEAIARCYSELLNGKSPTVSDIAKMTNQWVILGGIGMLVLGFSVGHLFSAKVEPLAKFLMASSWTAMLVVGWKAGDFFRYKKASLPYCLHWLSLLVSWWSLHELFISNSVPNSNLFVGVPLDAGSASGLLTLGIAYFLGAGFYMRSEQQRPEN